MEIIVQRKEILKAFHRVLGVVEKRTSQPILTYGFLRAQNDKIEVICTDLKILMNASYSAEVKTEGCFCVSAKVFYDVVNEISADEISINVKDNQCIVIKAEKSIFKLMGIDPDDYPLSFNAEIFFSLEMKRNFLLEMINKTLFTVGTGVDEEYGYNIGGIEIEVDFVKSTIQFTGADRHRVAIVKRNILDESVEISGEKINQKIIVPKKTILEIKKLLLEDDGNVSICFGKRHLVFKKKGVEVISRLLEGFYPSYDTIIPKEIGKRVCLEKEIFRKAIRRVSLLSSDITNCVEMAVESEKIILRTENPLVGDAMETFPIEYEGSGMMISFNYKYMLDVIPVIKSDNVLIEVEHYKKPLVVRDKNDEEFIYMLMPLLFKRDNEDD